MCYLFFKIWCRVSELENDVHSYFHLTFKMKEISDRFRQIAKLKEKRQLAILWSSIWASVEDFCVQFEFVTVFTRSYKLVLDSCRRQGAISCYTRDVFSSPSFSDKNTMYVGFRYHYLLFCKISLLGISLNLNPVHLCLCNPGEWFRSFSLCW